MFEGVNKLTEKLDQAIGADGVKVFVKAELTPTTYTSLGVLGLGLIVAFFVIQNIFERFNK